MQSTSSNNPSVGQTVLKVLSRAWDDLLAAPEWKLAPAALESAARPLVSPIKAEPFRFRLLSLNIWGLPIGPNLEARVRKLALMKRVC
jgi:hypothetical protein